ncbi:hypothetical protein F5Y08DRAFT_313640 [Xylaria arbuscula]|uniref:Uncharacterized protein n=1 Tax=Xylaria arbuscula TaxID=114810 RepID=A0A9W8TKZ7_9PEZI|nr:hypothetical protein F5Y08DRAFT_313640 [Xylaria arbuscula]KAJ3567144.1 hypothetical protein NPX13_g6872 [Xylaria arbuscula]
MPVVLGRPLLFKNNEYIVAPDVKHWKRDDEGPVLLSAIIFPVIVILVLVPFFILMYRAWRWERVNGRNTKLPEIKQEENGQFEKAELSCGSSVIISEMDSQSKAEELPEREGGRPHEMLGTMSFPQELPGDLLEMPAEVHKKS